jgi:putative ABC transport system permease protein
MDENGYNDNTSFSSSSSSPDIPPERMVLAVIPVVLVIILGLSLKLGNVRTLIVASTRCVVQLLLLGLILSPVFLNNQVYVVMPYLLVMILFATREASVKPKFQYVGMKWHMLLAITISLTGSLLLITFGVLQPDPWWDAQVLIPVGGMMLGSCVNALSLGMDRFLLSLTGGVTSKSSAAAAAINSGSSLSSSTGGGGGGGSGSALLQTYLACGATRWEAALPSIREGIETGLTPNLNQMSVMGLVSIPGMFTGQILAGTPPWIAAKYQIVIMFFISCSSTWILFLCMIQAIHNKLFVGKNHFFRGDLVWKRSGGKPKDIVLALLSNLGDAVKWARKTLCRCRRQKKGGDLAKNHNDGEGCDSKQTAVELNGEVTTKELSASTTPSNPIVVDHPAAFPNTFVRKPATPSMAVSPEGRDRPSILSLKKGSLSYGSRILLQEVDLDLYEGEIMILSGASGTGKSSFLRALALLQSWDSGDLFFKGKRCGTTANGTGIKPTEWRSEVLYIRQAGGQGLEGTPKVNLDKICELRSQRKRLPREMTTLYSRFASNLEELGLNVEMMNHPWGSMSGE